MYSLGIGVGDVLLATAVIKAWKRKHNQRLPVLTFYPQIFANNPDTLFAVDTNKYQALIKHLGRPVLWRVAEIITSFTNSLIIGPNYPFPCQGAHLVDAMAESMDVSLLPHERRPFLYLTPTEIEKARWASGCIVVQSSSTNNWTVNKHWVFGRMQKVVDKLNNAGHSLIHLGSKDDEVLTEVQDLRGKTSIREAAAILSNVVIFVGMEGGLIHLSRSVGRRAVVIYTGYTRPEETGYPENINLRDPKAGAGCWRRMACAHCQQSAEKISVELVVETILTAIREESVVENNSTSR